MLRAAGYESTRSGIDSGYQELGQMEYDSYDMWLVPPDQVQAMAKELQPASFAQFVSAGLAAEVSDRHGTKLDESEYAGYFEDGIATLDPFLNTAAQDGHSLLFTEA